MERRSAIERPLWTCPKCGNRFANKNNWHSCGVWTLDDHFRGREALLPVYEAFLAAVEAMGPVTVVISKTRIAFMNRVRFAGCQVRKDRLIGSLWLRHEPAADAPFARIDRITPRDWVCSFPLRGVEDLTEDLLAQLRLATAVGAQEHLKA